MKTSSLLCLVVASLLLGVQAQAAPKITYIDPKTVDMKQVLPGRQRLDHPEIQAELNEVLRLQGTRTPAEIDRAKSEAPRDPIIFAEVLGPWSDPTNLPASPSIS